ncbi:hypothetical protein NMH_1204 [Neisseria meningitidis H44/76]|uniref:Uncharacterized protein n=1 Tax=Neisseria meningitidis serogroup B / serotype 15 (strain H44/76) TaxID=909420 RepID=E6MXW6_NEIMH|nr:hypothetical protein NMH_1204 [Neisseria meningitidis H44/76]
MKNLRLGIFGFKVRKCGFLCRKLIIFKFLFLKFLCRHIFSFCCGHGAFAGGAARLPIS